MSEDFGQKYDQDVLKAFDRMAEDYESLSPAAPVEAGDIPVTAEDIFGTPEPVHASAEPVITNVVASRSQRNGRHAKKTQQDAAAGENAAEKAPEKKAAPAEEK